MKKIIVGTILVIGIASAGVAFAYGNNGQGDGHPMRPVGGECQMVDQVSADKYRVFQKENKGIFRNLAVKSAEERALGNSTAPDLVAVAKVAGEVFDLHESLRGKAIKSGIEPCLTRGEGGKKMMGHHMQSAQMDPVMITKMTTFKNENVDLRRQLSINKNVKRVIMHSENPSVEKIATLTGEIFDIQSALFEKAKIAGIPYGMGQHEMKGKHGKQHGDMARGDRF